MPAAQPLWRLDIWRYEAGASSSNPDIVSDDARVYFVQQGLVKAIEAETGQQLWTFEVGKWVKLEVGVGYLIVVRQEAVYVLDARTGVVRWRQTYRTPEGVETFFVHEDLLVIIVGERFIAYELATGQERWRVRGLYGLTRDPHHSALSASGSVIFLALSYHSLNSSPDVFAFDHVTGERLWKVWSHFNPLAVVNDKVYLLDDNRNMDIYPGRFKVDVFSLRSGKPLGENVYNLNPVAELNNPSAYPHSWDYGRMRIYKDTLYIEAKKLKASEANIARFALGSKGTRPTFVKRGADLKWLAGPYNDRLFVLERKGRQRRFQVGKLGGASLAPVTFDGTYQIGSSPISRLDLSGNGLYVGHTDGQLYVVDMRTGSALFHFETQAKSFGPSHIVGDTLIIQAGNELLAFALPKELRP